MSKIVASWSFNNRDYRLVNVDDGEGGSDNVLEVRGQDALGVDRWVNAMPGIRVHNLTTEQVLIAGIKSLSEKTEAVADSMTAGKRFG